jgi:4-amino-4-deoxy-L-arabinose transferase-like glycosyltransferase
VTRPDPSADRASGWTAAAELRWFDRLAALALGAAFVAILLATTDIGFTRDEGFYFRAAYQYLGWLKILGEGVASLDVSEAFSQAAIDKHMGYNQEHPVLPKLLFAGSYWLFHEGLGWLRPSDAMRLPGILSAGLLTYLVYTFTTEAYGRIAAVVACVALAAMPRPFFHAHLACFDAMMVTMWFFCMVAWWRGMRSTGWAWGAGVVFGVAMSVKHNAFFLPALFLVHFAIVYARSTRFERGTAGELRLRLPNLPIALVSMAIVGPIVWYVLWPNHWFDTYARVAWYLKFHLHHVHYFQYFFGENLYAPPFPFHFPFTLSAITLPPVTVLAAGVGVWVCIARWWRGRREKADARGTGWLVALGLLVPVLIIAMPSTPIFGGIKHWTPAMPFLAVLAGVGVVETGRALGVYLGRLVKAPVVVPVTLALAALVLTPAVLSTAHSHPNGTAHYNVLVGGVRGAADLKAMRQFWGYAGGDANEFLVERLDGRGSVFWQNTTHDAYRMYQADGDLPRTISYGGMEASQYGMIHHQMAFVPLETKIWRAYRTRNPEFVSHHDGVPVLRVYRNTTRPVRKRR